MSTELISSQSLGANELRTKQAELTALQTALAERELYLADLRIHLAAFEGRYLRQVGVLYAELDEWNAKIAELLAAKEGTQDAVATAKEARTQANESYSATHGEASQAPDLEEPTPELKRLFREVAKQIHPDLATDEADRTKRGQLMADANAAFRRGDAAALRAILAEYENSPEAVKGIGMAADLLRVERQILQISKRLVEIEVSIAELTSSEMAKLMSKVHSARDAGVDLLGEMAADLQEQVAMARNRYTNLTSGTGTMSEPKPPVSLVRHTTALSRNPASALATRALQGLRARETAEYWLQKGLEHEKNSVYDQSFRCFSRGLGISPNHAELQYQIGLAYLYGDGVGKDDAAALAWHQKSAEQGHAGAQYELYLHYFYGVGVDRDIPTAAFWFEKAVSQNPQLAINGEDLALAYENGDGVAKDPGLALHWYRRAADQGNAEALYRVGLGYWKGVQVPLDQKEAAAWWYKAADRGHATANFMVATLHIAGFLVPQDHAKAAAHFRKAAEAGHADAQNWLGIAYENAQGVNQDLKEAAFWYRKAAEQNQKKAPANLKRVREAIGSSVH